MESLPYPDGHFSKCCTINSLFYWQDARKGMAEIFRVLEDGGRIVVCVTCKHCLEIKSFARAGISLYEENELCELLTDAGFGIVKIEHACASGASKMHQEIG